MIAGERPETACHREGHHCGRIQERRPAPRIPKDDQPETGHDSGSSVHQEASSKVDNHAGNRREYNLDHHPRINGQTWKREHLAEWETKTGIEDPLMCTQYADWISCPDRAGLGIATPVTTAYSSSVDPVPDSKHESRKQYYELYRMLSLK